MRVNGFLKSITGLFLLAAIVISIVACTPTEGTKSDTKKETIEDVRDSVEESADESTQEEKIAPVVTGKMYTNAKVNVRETPSIGGTVHCTLDSQEVVQVIEIGEEWTSVLIDEDVFHLEVDTISLNID